MGAAVDHDPARVDAFLQPELGQRLTEAVGADGGEIGRVGAKPRRCDHGVRGVAAKPLHEGSALVRLVEFDQRFANREKIRHALPRRNGHRDPAIRPPAARLTNRIARVERRRVLARLAASA